MKTEFKVLLYLKRNGQGKDGLCPLMGRIMIKATGNSTTQFGCKIRVDPKLWNATSQRCTGKSRMAIATNRAIDKMMLLLQRRYSELAEISDDITATQIRDAFQGMAEKQVTLLGLFREHNEEYALRVGVNRAANTLYLYWHTFHFVEEFIKVRYKVSDIPFKALDESFVEAFELYLRIDRKFQAGTSRGHIQRLKHIARIAVSRAIVPFSPFKDFSPMKPKQKQRNISTTQRYAKVTDEKVDRDVTVLEHEITGKYTLSGIDQPPSTILKDMSLREIRRRERKEILNPMEGV